MVKNCRQNGLYITYIMAYITFYTQTLELVGIEPMLTISVAIAIRPLDSKGAHIVNSIIILLKYCPKCVPKYFAPSYLLLQHYVSATSFIKNTPTFPE